MVGDTGINANMKGNCIARALYDNVAESPDELAFRRDDVLTVLEQNTAGLEGWWLCSLRGRQGICPGNRLRLLPGVYDNNALASLTSPNNTLISTSPTPRHPSTSPTPRPQRPLSNKVVTPKRVGDIYTYDTPRSHGQGSQLDYDVPPTRHSPLDGSGARLSRSSSLRYEAPRQHIRSSLDQYDVPRPQYDTPRMRSLYDSPRPQQHYDSPRAHQEAQHSAPRSLIKGIRGGAPSSHQPPHNPHNQQEYDVPRPTHSHDQHYEVPPSDRSSGVSVMSCESSQLSTSSSASSLAASESLSLSSLGGSSNRSSLESHDVYDIPPEPRRVGDFQRPRLPPRESKEVRDAYDVPRSGLLNPYMDMYDTPPSRRPHLTHAGEGVYDIPPQVSRDVRQPDSVDGAPNRLSSGSDSSGGDFDVGFGKELPLELDSALDTLEKLQQEVYRAIEKLSLIHQSCTWLSHNSIQERENEIKNAILRLRQSVQNILDFGQGSVVNAAKNGERGLARRLQRLIEPVTKTLAAIDDALVRLQSGGWTQAITCGTNPENLNQLATMAHSLADDVRHLASTIHTKGSNIFKKSPVIDVSGYRYAADDDEKTPVQERPLPDLPEKRQLENMYENDARAWLEDYDYVNLETRESVEREHEEIKKELPAQLHKSFDNLVKQSQLIVDSDHEKVLHREDNNEKQVSQLLEPNDRQVISFYGTQAELHLQHLNTAIDAFLLTIENNQPPKVFIAHSKFVILNAHKLVYIGDTVHRNVGNEDVRTRVLNCSNALCDAMKNTVSAAKTAAMQFPSVVAVQAMVDAFVSVSHLANNLKQAVSL